VSATLLMRTLRALGLMGWAGVAGMAVGCSGDDGPRDAGTDVEGPKIVVSGVAAMHPDAVAWLTGAGQPVPSVEGLNARAEEPLAAALGDTAGEFGSQTLPADGTFSIADVPTTPVTLGLAVRIRDEAVGARRVISAATLVYDVGIEQRKPDDALADRRAFAVPTAFHQQLSSAVGAAAIRAVTQNAESTLEDAGFVLGKVVDAQGLGVAGVKMVPNRQALAAQLFYPNAALTSTQVATSETGLFVFVNAGGTETTLAGLTVEGRPEYREQALATTSGSGLVLFVAPPPQAP